MTPNGSRTVRRATSDDLDRLVPLFSAYREFYQYPAEPVRERAFLAERLPKGESVVFLAEEGDAAIGFIQLYPLFSSLSLLPVWVLNDLYVLPGSRRRGVASGLLRRAQEFARATGAEYLTLETAVDNPAQLLYEREGWTRDERFLHYERKVTLERRTPRRSAQRANVGGRAQPDDRRIQPSPRGPAQERS